MGRILGRSEGFELRHKVVDLALLHVHDVLVNAQLQRLVSKSPQWVGHGAYRVSKWVERQSRCLDYLPQYVTPLQVAPISLNPPHLACDAVRMQHHGRKVEDRRKADESVLTTLDGCIPRVVVLVAQRDVRDVTPQIFGDLALGIRAMDGQLPACLVVARCQAKACESAQGGEAFLGVAYHTSLAHLTIETRDQQDSICSAEWGMHTQSKHGREIHVVHFKTQYSTQGLVGAVENLTIQCRTAWPSGSVWSR